MVFQFLDEPHCCHPKYKIVSMSTGVFYSLGCLADMPKNRLFDKEQGKSHRVVDLG